MAVMVVIMVVVVIMVMGGGNANAIQTSFEANGQRHRSERAWWHADAPVLSKRD